MACSRLKALISLPAVRDIKSDDGDIMNTTCHHLLRNSSFGHNRGHLTSKWTEFSPESDNLATIRRALRSARSVSRHLRLPGDGRAFITYARVRRRRHRADCRQLGQLIEQATPTWLEARLPYSELVGAILSLSLGQSSSYNEMAIMEQVVV